MSLSPDAKPPAEAPEASQTWPGATLAELTKYLDARYGRDKWWRRDSTIYVFGDQDGAAEQRWWRWGVTTDYCRKERKR